MLTLATGSATAALGSLYLLYQRSSVKAGGREGGVVAVKVRSTSHNGHFK